MWEKYLMFTVFLIYNAYLLNIICMYYYIIINFKTEKKKQCLHRFLTEPWTKIVCVKTFCNLQNIKIILKK